MLYPGGYFSYRKQDPFAIIPARMHLHLLFRVSDLLKQRGFTGIKESEIEDTLLGVVSVKQSPLGQSGFLNGLNESRFRQAVRRAVYGDIRNHDKLLLREIQLEACEENQRRYAKTIELLLAHLALKDLSATSASFGVNIDGSPNGSDFDCILGFQNTLFHLEIKSGNARNISKDDLQSFLFRHEFLSPEASILFLDYNGVGIEVIRRFFGLKLSRKGTNTISRILSLQQESKRAYLIEPGILVVDIGKNSDTLSNMRYGIQILYRYKTWHQSATWQLAEPRFLGLDGTILESPST